jgi:hypothetical protein
MYDGDGFAIVSPNAQKSGFSSANKKKAQNLFRDRAKKYDLGTLIDARTIQAGVVKNRADQSIFDDCVL